MRFASPLIHLFRVLWWGSLTTIGFIVVPLLFLHLDNPQSAGRMAAVLFSVEDYLAWTCGALLLTMKPNKAMAYLTTFALVASLLIHFMVSPHIVARENLHVWHSVGTALYVVQWVFVTILLFICKRL